MATQISLTEAAKRVKELPKTEQSTLKGGVLLVCEEKRHTTSNNIFYTMTIVANDTNETGVTKMF